MCVQVERLVHLFPNILEGFLLTSHRLLLLQCLVIGFGQLQHLLIEERQIVCVCVCVCV